jgi:sec-independent protein translocase protein TatB
MFSFSPEKVFVLGLIALIVLGPKRLPEVARTVGRFVATFRRMSSGLQAEVRDVLAEPKDAFDNAIGDFRSSGLKQSWKQSMRSTISSTLSSPAPPADTRPEGRSSEPTQMSGSEDGSRSLGPPDGPSLN